MVTAAQRRTERALVSVPTAAALLGLNTQTVRNAIRRGEVPSVQINGREWVARAVVDRILAAATAQTAGHDTALCREASGEGGI